jgi:hypothetical protein
MLNSAAKWALNTRAAGFIFEKVSDAAAYAISKWHVKGERWDYAWDAYKKSGILPWHADRIRAFADENNLEIYFTGTKRSAGIWNIAGVSAKPEGWGASSDEAIPRLTSLKSGINWSSDFEPTLIRSDYDLLVVMEMKNGQRVRMTDADVNKFLVPRLDAAVRNVYFVPNVVNRKLYQIQHATTLLTYKGLYTNKKIGHPGAAFGFIPNSSAMDVTSPEQLRAFMYLELNMTIPNHWVSQ